MKMRAKLLVTALVFAGFAMSASASPSWEVTWFLNDVTFSNGDMATGYFTTNNSITSIDAIAVVITGPNAFPVTQMPLTYLAYVPSEVGIANTDFSDYIDLYLASSLTGTGGIIPITSGVDCPGCGTLIVNSDTELIGIAPEPKSLLLFGSGLLLLGGVFRKRCVLDKTA
jgi:hypothetical protein